MIKDCWSKDTNKVNTTKDYWSKEKNKVNTTRYCWSKDTNKVGTTKDCRCKETSTSGPYNNKDKRGEGKGKGKGKNSVKQGHHPDRVERAERAKRAERAERAEKEIPTEGTTISVNQISRITQDDATWDRPLTQNVGEEHELGYVSATIIFRKPIQQPKDWYAVRIWG